MDPLNNPLVNVAKEISPHNTSPDGYGFALAVITGVALGAGLLIYRFLNYYIKRQDKLDERHEKENQEKKEAFITLRGEVKGALKDLGDKLHIDLAAIRKDLHAHDNRITKLEIMAGNDPPHK